MKPSFGASIFSCILFILVLLPPCRSQQSPATPTVCVVGSGIGGSSVAHFLRRYSEAISASFSIRMFERNDVVGGRMAVVNVAGETFEAGASILHPKNFHAVNFTKMLNLTMNDLESSDCFSLGIWDGKKFVFKTLQSSFSSKFPFVDKIVLLANKLLMFLRYGFSLFRMDNFVESTVGSFLKYYESFESRPMFETVDEMLSWAGLYNLTTRTLHEELIDAGLSPLLIAELITVITRINYGQNVSMSGLAGAVSLAGSGDGLWSVKGGNWQMAAGLISNSDVSLHLQEEIESISQLGGYYEVNSTKGNSYSCEVVVVATPLDELDIEFTPQISRPKRELQHTHATFVRGVVNPAFFGLDAVSEIPILVGTTEEDDLPFSSISVLKQHDDKELTYKVFSRKLMTESLLDEIFSARKETIRINWGAYPRYKAPEAFAPFILDGHHLYYVNAFENAASTMETSAVAAENIARLILSRFFSNAPLSSSTANPSHGHENFHSDL